MLTLSTCIVHSDVALVNILCYNGSMPAKRPYHHTELKQTLLDAAVALIAEVGPQAFTLREVARRAGVSHNAPYRHFTDKDDLLAAVAAQGFDRLTESMQKSMLKGHTAAERLRLAGRGYVQFALSWPQHILVMFDGPRVQAPRPEHAAAARRAFQTLLDAIAAVQSEGALPKGDPQAYAVVAWAGVHGLAKLAISGRLPFGSKQTIEFADYVTRVLAEGMADVPVPAVSGGRRRE
jgi:AcrR family transcriptional regulator